MLNHYHKCHKSKQNTSAKFLEAKVIKKYWDIREKAPEERRKQRREQTRGTEGTYLFCQLKTNVLVISFLV